MTSVTPTPSRPPGTHPAGEHQGDQSPEGTVPPAGRSLRSRRVLVVIGLTVLLVLVVLVSLGVGAKPIAIPAVWEALWSPSGTDDDIIIVRDLRVPRALLGILIGMALGVAGALMQGHTRNPLAEPGLLGVNAGAAFFVVLAIYLLGVTSLFGYVWFAFAGAFVASVVVFLLGSLGRGGPTPVTLALAGVAVSMLLVALTTAVVLQAEFTLDSYRFWVVGALAGRDPSIIVQVAPFLLVGLVLAAANAPGLNLLSMGEDVARSLGQQVAITRWLGLAAITLLAGGAVAACGPIWFLGLIVPHVARALTGPDYRWILPVSALTGGILLLLADMLGRVAARPGELQVGIVLALIGAPFFIALIRRRRLVTL